MSTVRKPLIAGNWKMNFDHLQALAFVQKLGWSLNDIKHDLENVEIVIFPPFTDLRSVQTLVDADKLRIGYGAQDVSQHGPGAYTGEIAAEFLQKLGAQYVITGHSERRSYHGESDELIGKKSAAALRQGITPVICVGETAEDLEAHGAAAVPLQQVTAVLAELPENAEVVIAYEPVWAIGSGKAATASQAQEVCGAIRQKITELRGEAFGEKTRILYGGSVKSENIAEFMKQPDIDGALIGGASLKVEEFTKIAQFKKHITV